MSIKVIIDGSLEGKEIKEALESDSFSSNLQKSFALRWGNYIDKQSDDIVFNSSHSIKNTLYKEDVLLTLKRNHINCPRRIKPGKKTEFPIIGRKYNHANGEDIKIIDSLEETKKSDSDYFVEYLRLIDEYRVHVMDTNVFFVEKKVKDDESDSDGSSDNNDNGIEIENLDMDDKVVFDKKDIFINQKILDSKYGFDEPIIRTCSYGWKLVPTDLSRKNSFEKNEIANLAVKAVYALGLDFGVVNLGMALNGRYYVIDVDATCKYMSEECRNAYMKNFSQMIATYDRLTCFPEDIKIGADPECVIKDNDTGSLIFASDFFSRDGSLGLDARSIEAGKKYFPLMEIRPDYSSNPLEVFESIRSIIKSSGQYIHYKNVGLYSGSMPVNEYWVGGHIHFNIKPNTKFLRALDNYLALPMMMIEKTFTARQRKTKYGALGNFRLKSHGGFEYCTLSSWLVTPEITSAVLCLAKVIAQEYFNLKDEFLCNYSDTRAYYSVNKAYFRDVVEKIIKNIEATDTFKNYYNEIKPLFNKLLAQEEWEEDKDIKLAWGLTYSDEVYKPLSRCFIPKKKRDELNIKLGDKINIMIGRNKYELSVYPKDDFSTEKNSYVSFSEDICNELGIKESDCVGIWFDSENNIFRGGPVLGIFSFVVDHAFGPFGNQSYYFRKLIKFSKEKGMIAYVFTMWETDWNNNRIYGYTYDFNSKEWVKKYFAVPDVIYNRGDVISEDNYEQRGLDFLSYISTNKIKFINSLECVSLTNNKWETYALLNSKQKTRSYMPKTSRYTNNNQILKYLEQYGHIFIKLKEGSRSKGIFSVENLGNGSFEVIHKSTDDSDKRMVVEESNLVEVISDTIRLEGYTKNDYIIQQAIPLTHYQNRNFEIRVVMQKNSENYWFRTCMTARCTGENEQYISVIDEVNLKASQVLSACFGDKTDEIIYKIRKASKEIISVIDSKGIQSGELAIDFVIDKELNIYAIELNSKPDNLLALIGAFKMRNLAMYRILEYARFLAKN